MFRVWRLGPTSTGHLTPYLQVGARESFFFLGAEGGGGGGAFGTMSCDDNADSDLKIRDGRV